MFLDDPYIRTMLEMDYTDSTPQDLTIHKRKSADSEDDSAGGTFDSAGSDSNDCGGTSSPNDSQSDTPMSYSGVVSTGHPKEILPATKSNYLPPCKVCNGPATGFHYGANTCEACKAFFRRYTGQECNLKPCKQLGRCLELAKKGKISCARCRYAKCVQIGMTKLGIKKGRYTYEKRFQDAIELRKMQELENNHKLTNPELNTVVMAMLCNGFAKHFPDLSYILNNKHSVNCTIDSLVPRTAPRKSQIIQVSRGSSFNNEEHLFYQSLDRIANHQLQTSSAHQSLDMDSLKMIWLGLSSNFEKEFSTVACFAKIIPGFTKLELEDQITLLKAAYIEVMVLLRCISVRSDIEAFVKYYSGSNELRLIPLSLLDNKQLGEDFHKYHNKLLGRVQKLQLTPSELAILIAVIILSPDREGIINSDAVQELQNTLLPVLQFSFTSKQEATVSLKGAVVPAATSFAEVILLLPMLRESSVRFFLPEEAKSPSDGK